MNTRPLHAVLICDVVGSRSIDEFKRRRDDLLSRLSAEHQKRGLIASRYTITTWDEFQTIVPQAPQVVDVVWELRRDFRPWELKIGIGIGSLDDLPGPHDAINESAMGEAFLRARSALTEMHEAAHKYRVLTRCSSPGAWIETATNGIYDLMDTLLLDRTDRQWETAIAYENDKRLEVSAQRLGIDESTVSRNLQRGYHWQILEARRRLRELLAMHESVQVLELAPDEA